MHARTSGGCKGTCHRGRKISQSGQVLPQMFHQAQQGLVFTHRREKKEVSRKGAKNDESDAKHMDTWVAIPSKISYHIVANEFRNCAGGCPYIQCRLVMKERLLPFPLHSAFCWSQYQTKKGCSPQTRRMTSRSVLSSCFLPGTPLPSTAAEIEANRESC